MYFEALLNTQMLDNEAIKSLENPCHPQYLLAFTALTLLLLTACKSIQVHIFGVPQLVHTLKEEDCGLVTELILHRVGAGDAIQL